MESLEINVKNIIGTSYCVDTEDGTKIYDKIIEGFGNDKKVVLSFAGVELVISAFLNIAVGQLFKSYDESKIEECLSIKDLDEKFQCTWDLVYQGAPIYYKNKQTYDNNYAEVMEE